ncbi:hypothetical protein ACQ4M4_10090 [Leptolyngbya sp. AN02str]|uniref:hypothetical protein n=1 Tax=Leptolyngbya sp. AN02str TaxID=3423363 RepID=UPI003D31E25B
MDASADSNLTLVYCSIPRLALRDKVSSRLGLCSDRTVTSLCSTAGLEFPKIGAIAIAPANFSKLNAQGHRLHL